MNSNSQSVWSTHKSALIGAICGLVAIFITAYKGVISSDPAVNTIVVTAVCVYIAIFLQLHFFSVSNEKRIEKLAESYISKIDGAKLRVFDTPMDALIYFSSVVADMDKVRNTSICALDEIDNVRDVYMNDKNYEKYIMAVEKPLINNSLRYEDILTPGILEIKEHRYYRLMKRNLGTKYHAKMLDSDIKFTEFTIIEYKGEKAKEVMFGWDHAVRRGTASVFLTDHDKLVEYFENMFDYLWSKSNDIDVSPQAA